MTGDAAAARGRAGGRLRARSSARSRPARARASRWPDPHTVAFGITVAEGARRLPACSTPCATPAAPRSRSPTRRCWPTQRRVRRRRGPAALPGGRGRAGGGPPAAPGTAGSGRTSEVVVLNTGSPLVQPELLPPAPADRLTGCACSDRGRACWAPWQRVTRSSTPAGRSRSRTAARRRSAWKTRWPRWSGWSGSASTTWRPTSGSPGTACRAAARRDAGPDHRPVRRGPRAALGRGGAGPGARAGAGPPPGRAARVVPGAPDQPRRQDAGRGRAAGRGGAPGRRGGPGVRRLVLRPAGRRGPGRAGSRGCARSLGPRGVLGLRLGSLRAPAAAVAPGAPDPAAAVAPGAPDPPPRSRRRPDPAGAAGPPGPGRRRGRARPARRLRAGADPARPAAGDRPAVRRRRARPRAAWCTRGR